MWKFLEVEWETLRFLFLILILGIISDMVSTSKTFGGFIESRRNARIPWLCPVDFNNEQKKLDPAAIKKQQIDTATATADKIAADAAAAAKTQQDRASASNAAALCIDHAEKAQAAQMA